MRSHLQRRHLYQTMATTAATTAATMMSAMMIMTYVGVVDDSSVGEGVGFGEVVVEVVGHGVVIPSDVRANRTKLARNSIEIIEMKS